MTYTHGHIIPLIGGSVIGTSQALDKDPEWIASWSNTFGANDKYCLEYYSHIPYYDLDTNNYPTQYVDIITSLPPCAGLSMGNATSGDRGRNPRGCNAPSNIHMLNASEYAMDKIKPLAIMVENAPTLYSAMGEPFAERINGLAKRYNYSMSLVKTSTIYHGVPQERTRSFFFLWKGSKAPILNPIRKEHRPFHEFMRVLEFADSELVNNKPAPSSDPLWQFIESKFPGLSKQEILERVASKGMVSVWNVIYNHGWLPEAAQVVTDERAKRWLNYTLDKKNRGLNIMDGSTKLAWSHTAALMWKSLPHLMHPYEDRWLKTSEALALMGFPYDFSEKVSISTKNQNVICQNVPVVTAKSWVEEIVEALNGNREWVETEGRILRQSNVSKKDLMKPIWKL